MTRNKTIASFFAFLLLLPILSSLIIIVQNSLVRLEMEEALERESLEVVSLPLSAVIWLDNGDEALLDGELFDVKSFHISGNMISLTGLYDYKEKALQEKVSNIQDKQGTESTITYKALFIAFLPFRETISLTDLYVLPKKSFYPFLSTPLKKQSLTVNVPPPRA